MVSPSEWIPHILSFLDLGLSQSQHDASLDKIASFIKADMLTLENLVGEMEMYLTTTDAVVRPRGILLLAQVLTRLVVKPLADVAIHSLIEFFTSRLADWQALRGALIGCLALIRRSSSVGMVLEGDAINLAQAFLENLQVQALAQEDRKLCFELLESLLSLYPNALQPLGNNLVDGVCVAIDEEKDPWCLLHCFHIVELLVDLFPDPSGPVATASKDIFELLSRYFPIYFTHGKTDAFDVRREELSRALMCALSSTPSFEPFCIPMLLEKLTSSLKIAKLDALKYLSHCAKIYGPERMSKHVKSIWLSLKEIIFTSSEEPKASFSLELVEKTESNESEEVKEALVCLASCILVDGSKEVLLPLVIQDDNMMMIFSSIIKDGCSEYMSPESRKRLCAFVCILSSSAKVSAACCTQIFQIFFSPLMDAVGISTRALLLDTLSVENHTVSCKLGFGALYLCAELLTVARQLAVDLASQKLHSQAVSVQDDWFLLLCKFAEPLALGLRAALLTAKDISTTTINQAIGEADTRGAYVVRCLQVLATFPGCSPISINMFENVLRSLVLVITESCTQKFLRQCSLKALAQIGMFLEKFGDSGRQISYKCVVIERLFLWLANGDSAVPLSLKLDVVCEVGTTATYFGLRTLEGLKEFLSTNLVAALVKGYPHCAKMTAEVLGCVSRQMLPWLQEKGSNDNVYLLFFESLWLCLDAIPEISLGIEEHGLLDALMVVMSLLVSYCTEVHQSLMVQKTYQNLLAKTSFLCIDENNFAAFGLIENSRLASDPDILSSNDKWIVSLLASVIFALRPHVLLPDARMLLKIFTFSVIAGLEAAAQALGSMINKWPLVVNKDAVDTYSLEEAMNFIFGIFFQNVPWNNQGENFEDLNSGLNIYTHIDLGREHLLDSHAIIGLAWVAKGLVMRGHQMFKNVVILLLCCLSPSRRVKDLTLQNSLENDTTILCTTSKCLADAFHIITSDSENSLNKNFHASIRPLYKQRFFSFILPLISQAIKEFDHPFSKSMLYRAFGHIICNTPIAALLSESDKIIPFLLDCLHILSEEELNKHLIYSLLLVLSGILMDENGKGAVLDNVPGITSNLVHLVTFPHLMIVRETTVQCLVAITGLPQAKIYPYRRQVLKAIKKALDDRKRSVRQEAVRCHQAWLSIA